MSAVDASTSLTLTLGGGRIDYEEYGDPKGRPIVFVHGYSAAASLWRPVAERLGALGLRCLAPTWPFGSHKHPMPDADLSMPGLANMVAEFCEALSLRDVVVLGNDSGGVVAQLVAVDHPERIGAVALTSCDAFEHFPPPILGPFILASRIPTVVPFRAALLPMKTSFARRRGFGALAHTDIDDLVREWVQPALSDAGVARDLRRLTASLRQETTLAVGARLGEFAYPALIAWSADDAFFPLEDGRRLAAAFADSRLEVIENARTLSMIDQPDRLAELVHEFAAHG